MDWTDESDPYGCQSMGHDPVLAEKLDKFIVWRCIRCDAQWQNELRKIGHARTDHE